MIRLPVNATNIISIGYDETEELLEIEFKIKAIHQYHNVPFGIYIYLITSPNIEEYYINNILPEYRFEALK